MDDTDTKIVELLRQHLPEVSAVYHFGSSATQRKRPGSDIDLAVLAPQPLDAVRLWEVAQIIARHLDSDVDLVDLSTASTVMRAQVISTGRRLYCRQRTACDRFEDFVYSAYARLNEERQGILRDIKERGTVYG